MSSRSTSLSVLNKKLSFFNLYIIPGSFARLESEAISKVVRHSE